MAEFLSLKDAPKVARDRCHHPKCNTSPFTTKQRDAAFLFQQDCLLNDVKPLFIRGFQEGVVASGPPLCTATYVTEIG